MRLVQLVVRFPLQSQLGTGMATSLGASSTRLDFGYGDLAVRDYYPNPQPLILTLNGS